MASSLTERVLKTGTFIIKPQKATLTLKKSHYMKLFSNRLDIFANEEQSFRDPKFRIPRDASVVIERAETPLNAIKLDFNDLKLVIETKSEDDYRQWKDALKQVLVIREEKNEPSFNTETKHSFNVNTVGLNLKNTSTILHFENNLISVLTPSKVVLQQWHIQYIRKFKHDARFGIFSLEVPKVNESGYDKLEFSGITKDDSKELKKIISKATNGNNIVHKNSDVKIISNMDQRPSSEGTINSRIKNLHGGCSNPELNRINACGVISQLQDFLKSARNSTQNLYLKQMHLSSAANESTSKRDSEKERCKEPNLETEELYDGPTENYYSGEEHGSLPEPQKNISKPFQATNAADISKARSFLGLPKFSLKPFTNLVATQTNCTPSPEVEYDVPNEYYYGSVDKEENGGITEPQKPTTKFFQATNAAADPSKSHSFQVLPKFLSKTSTNPVATKTNTIPSELSEAEYDGPNEYYYGNAEKEEYYGITEPKKPISKPFQATNAAEDPSKARSFLVLSKFPSKTLTNPVSSQTNSTPSPEVEYDVPKEYYYGSVDKEDQPSSSLMNKYSFPITSNGRCTLNPPRPPNLQLQKKLVPSSMNNVSEDRSIIRLQDIQKTRCPPSPSLKPDLKLLNRPCYSNYDCYANLKQSHKNKAESALNEDKNDCENISRFAVDGGEEYALPNKHNY